MTDEKVPMYSADESEITKEGDELREEGDGDGDGEGSWLGS